MSNSHYESIFRPGLFDGKVALVTGAGSGIGRCMAHELGALGASLALIGRDADKLAKVQAELQEADIESSIFACDIRDEEIVKATVAAVLTHFGRIDYLVNNAGGQYATPIEHISKKGWEAVIASNLTGGFLMARECFLQTMREHGGAIVNMAADMWNGMPMMAHSGASRAGMVNFTMTAALEWGAYGVRVNAVAPGLVFSSGVESYPPEVQQQLIAMGKQTPLGRNGTESEASAAAVFLLSEGAAFISGTTINIDGGFSLATPNFKLPTGTGPAPEFNGFHLSAPPRLADSAVQGE